MNTGPILKTCSKIRVEEGKLYLKQIILSPECSSTYSGCSKAELHWKDVALNVDE